MESENAEIARTLVRVTVCMNLVLEKLGITDGEIEEAFKKANLGNFTKVSNRSEISRPNGGDSGEQRPGLSEIPSKGTDIRINDSGIENGRGSESLDNGDNSSGFRSDSD